MKKLQFLKDSFRCPFGILADFQGLRVSLSSILKVELEAQVGGGKEHLGNLFNMHGLVGRSATSGAGLLWRFLDIDDVHTCLPSQNLSNNITLNKVIDKI